MSLFPKAQSGYTFTGSGYDEETGLWVEGTKTSFSFSGTIQTMTANEIEALTGSRETNGMVKVYTTAVLKISEEGADQASDQVVFDGKVYEVIKALPYNNNLINHNKYVAAFREVDA